MRLQIRIRAINPDGTPRDFAQSTPKLSLIKTGLTGGTATVVIFENKPIEGPDIALSCTGLRFSDPPLGVNPFSGALPPYAGVYKPTDPAGMAPFNAIGAAGRWELAMSGLDGFPVIISCWNVTFKTVIPAP